MRTLFVPAARVPRDPAVISAWLDEAWTQIDTWVEGHVAMTTLTSQSGDMVAGQNVPQ